MYSELMIESFRTFQHLELKDLGKINLFFGPNNCGKTTILEAIFTHGCGLNFGPFLNHVLLKRDSIREFQYMEAAERFFCLFHVTSSLPYHFKIEGKFSHNISHTLSAQFHPSSSLSALDPLLMGQSVNDPLDQTTDKWKSYIESSKKPSLYLGQWILDLDGVETPYSIKLPSEISARSPLKMCAMHDILSHRIPVALSQIYSYLKRYNLQKEFLQELKKAFPSTNIAEIDFMPYPDGTQGTVYISLENGKKLPLYAFGDGMRRWFYLIGQMVVYKNSCHCIEEIDATFHPASYPDLSRLLLEYSEKYNNQLFLSSHSIEFTDIFLETLYGTENNYEKDDPVRLFTLKPSQATGQPDVWSLRGHDAYIQRKKYNLELR